MREIKFRGMDIDGKWYYGNLAILTENVRHLKQGHYISNSIGLPFAYQVRPETIGQLIVIKDKEFHEGDIIKYSYYRDHGQSGEYEERQAVIKWNEMQAGFEPFYHWNSYNYEMNKVEVIGTIYDREVKA